jgi:hypothetical protein
MPIDATFAYVIQDFYTVFLPQSIQILLTLAPIMLAVLLCSIFWDLWVNYVQTKQFLGLKYTLLEMTLPRDTWKSPRAMEIVLNSLHNSSDGSKYAQFWKGETRPWYSLELISIEGVVKFLIWTEDRRKQGVMSAIYSQYPEMEIREVEDYSKAVHFDPKELKVWAAEFTFSKAEKDNGWAYPIKTYVDYGLDKDPKEEFKTDPLLPLLEWLGSVGPNQQVWFQFLLRAHKKEYVKPGHVMLKYDPWKDQAEKEINKILMRDPETKVSGEDVVITRPDGTPSIVSKKPTISGPEQEIVDAIGRKLTKLPFDVGIRALYIAKKEIFNTPFGIGGIIGNMKQYNSESLNGFIPNGDKWTPSLSDPWQDYKDMRRNRFSRIAIKAYKRRSYFYPPFKSKWLVLNSEELATIYHFPGSVAQTPTLGRVPSKRSQAPANLPI